MYKKLLRLAIPLMGTAILSVAIVGYMSYEDARSLLVQTVTQRYGVILDDVRREVTMYTSRLSELGAQMAQQSAVRQLLDPSAPPRSEEAQRELLRDVRVLLHREEQLNSNYCSSLSVINTKYTMLADMNGLSEQLPLDTPYLTRALEGQPVSGVQLQSKGIPELYVATPVMVGGKAIGVVFATMALEKLAPFLRERVDVPADMMLVLTGEQHRILLASDSRQSPGDNYASTPAHLALYRTERMLAPADDTGERLGMRTAMPELGLNLLVCANKARLMAPATRLWENTLLYSGLGGLGCMLIVLVMLYTVMGDQVRSDARLARTVELAALATWEWDWERGKLRVNKYFNKMLSLPVDQLVYTRSWWTANVHPDDLAQLDVVVEDVRSPESVPWSACFRVRHADGHWHWLETRGNITHWDAMGNALHGMGVFHDVHEARVQAIRGLEYQQQLEAKVEARTRESEESAAALHYERSLLHTVIDTIEDYIYFKDLQSHYLGANRAMLEFFQCTADTLHGKHTESDFFRRILSPDEMRRSRIQDDAVIAQGKQMRFEETVQCTDGRVLHLETLKAIMRDRQGNPIGVVGVSRDISERKAAEAAIVQAKEDATAASRAKSEFLANMSHEIRTPLNGILGINHLAMQEPLSPKLHNYHLKMQTSARTLLSIVNDILDFSKIEAGRMELEYVPFTPRDVLQSTVDLLSPQAADRGNRLELDIDPALPPRIMGDSLRFGQILLNLAGNAVKFTLNGVVRLCARLEAAPSGEQAGLCRISVEDSGIGMDEARIDMLFQPFTQADTSTTRKYGGTGLGLAITRSLVEAMGSELQVRSVPGQGSTFSFVLAMEEPAESPDAAFGDSGAAGNTAEGSLNGVRVLLVEDNEINQMIAQESLKIMGCLVELAADGQEAVDILMPGENTAGQHFDVVLMDIQMPVMDGHTATRVLRERGYTGPIVAMTANAMREDRDRAMEAGMQDHVPKPIDFAELQTVLSRWVPRGAA